LLGSAIADRERESSKLIENKQLSGISARPGDKQVMAERLPLAAEAAKWVGGDECFATVVKLEGG
jgi:hypothetical protein